MTNRNTLFIINHGLISVVSKYLVYMVLDIIL
jgi:hypothetical protein